MKALFTADSARARITALVRRLVFAEVAQGGNRKSAYRDIANEQHAQEAKISRAWLKRAFEGRESFTPHLHFYEALIALERSTYDALEKQIQRQKQGLLRDEEQLAQLRRRNDALTECGNESRAGLARADGGKGQNRN